MLWCFAGCSAAAGVLLGCLTRSVLPGVAAALGCFLALHLLFAAVIAVSCLFVDLDRPVRRRSRYFSFLFRHFLAVAFFWGRIRLHIVGLERLGTLRNFMLVCNHRTIFDPVVLAAALPDRNLSFLSKKENYKIPVVRKFMHKLACLPLDREDDRQALKTILRAAKLLREQDLCMTVFPEGRTSPDGTLLPFRNGAFKLAQRAERPVVVAYLEGTQKIRRNLFRRRTDVTVEILQVIPEVTEFSTVQLGEQAHRVMADAEARQKEKDSAQR